MNEDNKKKVFQNWGFGMAPVKAEMTLKRQSWASAVMRIFQGKEDVKSDNLLASLSAISEVKGLFTRCYKKDQWDWFTVWKQLGYPEIAVCHMISPLLAEYRLALKNDADVKDITRILVQVGFIDCLEFYLAGSQSPGQRASGYVYILGTREQPHFLIISSTAGSVEERVNKINGGAGVMIPFGIRELFSTDAPEQAEDLIHKALAECRVREDRQFFDINIGFAKREIKKILEDMDLRNSRHGTVSSITSDYGYGFIKDESGSHYFFHKFSLRDCKFEALTVGTSVNFITQKTKEFLFAERVWQNSAK